MVLMIAAGIIVAYLAIRYMPGLLIVLGVLALIGALAG